MIYATTALATDGPARIIVLDYDNTEWEIVAVDEHGNCAIELEGMVAIFTREASGDRGTTHRVDEGQTFETASGQRFVVVMTNGSGDLGWVKEPS